MKQSRRRSLSGAIAALALVGSSCSLLQVPNDVGMKAVGVDLRFGAQIQKQQPFPQLPPLPALPTIDLNEDPVPEPPQKPPVVRNICPASEKISADRESKGEITSADMPIEGPIFTYYEGHFSDGRFMRWIGQKAIENVQENPEGTEYTFTVRDDETLLGLQMSFRVVYTRAEPEPDGIFLTQLVVPARDEETGTLKHYKFTPAVALQLMDFPITKGTRLLRESADLESKRDTPVPDPIRGGNLLQPSGNAIKSTFEVGGREFVEVCADLAHAWQSNWQLEISGDFNMDLTGVFWFDTSTGKGGWPVRADFVMNGELVSGAFLSNIMRLDPGDRL